MQLGEPLRLKFHDHQQKVKDEYLGKTAQFWLIYIETMRNQLQHRVSVQVNDFELRLLSLGSFIPLYFYYNMPTQDMLVIMIKFLTVSTSIILD